MTLHSEEYENCVESIVTVSVAMICYNQASYIGKAIESVLNQQTDFPIEICIGEDDSSDGTREICIDYAQRYPGKIRLFLWNREDACYIDGRASGTNNFFKTFGACRGKYIALLEGDDYWTDSLKLQKQYDALEANPNAVCCHHWQEVLLQLDGKEDEFVKWDDGYFPVEHATVGDIFSNRMRVKTRTAMYRNIEFLKDFLDWMFKVFAGDVPLSMIAGKFGDFVFIDEPMAVYRVHGKGYSGTGTDFTGEQHVERNLLWIDIWDYGTLFHSYQYARESRPVVLDFYKRAIKATRFFDLSVLFRLLSHRIKAPTSSFSYDTWIFMRIPCCFINFRIRQILKGISRKFMDKPLCGEEVNIIPKSS